VRLLRLALLPGAVGLAVAAEWYSYREEDLELALADGVVGLVLVTCGVIAWERRSESRVGPLMALAGFAWFAGNFAAGALYLHRGPLVHLHISYPTGRLKQRLAQTTVTAAYVGAAVEYIARNDVVTLVLTVLICAAAVDGFLRSSGIARRAGVLGLAAALGFAFVLALGAVQRFFGWDVDREVLLAYDSVIASLAVVLLVDLLRGRWAESVVADLVVDLGKRADTRTLRDELALALGDPTLVLAYWLPERKGYVDDAGRPVDLPPPGAGRALTAIDRHGERLAILVHDEVAIDDRALVEAVTSVARIAVSNARLQADVWARVLELAASRRRVVEAADRQRRLLERNLGEGVEQRLAAVEGLLIQAREDADEQASTRLTEVEDELARARAELRDIGRGIHPRSLTEGGLVAALPELVARSGLPVELDTSVGRLTPALEAAIYFLCSEALTNVAKHAEASRTIVSIRRSNGCVAVTIADDGVGGADPSRGSGLRGLVDRVEALSGELSVESPPGRGTEVLAKFHLDDP
jgi:signal transduction histidine kinase